MLSVSSDQFVPGGVKGVDTEDEEGSISEAVCLSLQGLDLVVGSFQWSGGYGMIVVCENSPSVSSKGLGEVLEYPDTRCLGPCDPVLADGPVAEALSGRDHRSLRSSFM